MAGAAIHFKSIDDTLEAFENRGVDAWAIFSGRNMNFKGVGVDDLREMLERLQRGSSNAAYTLKVYEGINNAADIKSNTADDGSFNFRLNGENQSLVGVQLYHEQRRQETRATLEKIAEAQERILERLEKLEEEPEEKPDDNKLGVIGDILGHPVIAPVAPMLIEAFTRVLLGAGATSPTTPAKPALGSIGNTSSTGEDAGIKQAIETLKKHDANLSEHLQKLARIAEVDPTSFKFLITSLESIQL